MTRRAARVTQAGEGPPRALRPCDVARMWQCSERHVRTLIAKGDLRHFRVGDKLVRIPVEAVTEYEQCRLNIAYANIEESSPSLGKTATAGTELTLARKAGRRPIAS